MNEPKLVSRPWEPKDLLDDLQLMIDEEPDRYLNDRRTTLCMARDFLKAYFDTGLEPEQIIRARDTLECFDNIGIKRGNEIVKAEQEGRLVVLPCKVGDTVFFRTYTQNATVDLGVQPHRVIAARCYMIVEGEYANVGLPVDQFGKTVFLTREEAEKALRGGNSDDP